MRKYSFDISGIDPRDLDRIERLRLMDDDFMSKCFEDDIECTELVVNIILGRDDIDVKEVHTQYLMKNLQGRSIILDIYAVDRAGKRYNIEIQRSDKGAGSHRARYNAGVIDSNVSTAGEAYDELADRARHFKRSEEGVRSMCRMLEEMREEVAEKTARETAKRSAQEFAYKSVKEGKFTVEEAKAFYGLTDKDVKEIFQTAI